MGPDSASSTPPRPRFSWDIPNVPWTDSKGNQEDYASSVKLWESCHDALPDSNSNKIPKNLRGIMLQSQLYGRARLLAKKIPEDKIRSDDGATAIVQAIYKRDPLAVVSEVFADFNALLNTKRGNNEKFKNFELRFEAQVAKFNAHSEDAKLPGSLVAFMLLGNSNCDNNQRVSVLAAAAPKAKFDDSATTSDFLKSVSYESIATVLRQCDRYNTVSTRESLALSACTAATRQSTRRTLSPEQLADLKSKSKCRKCAKYGHWASVHNSDGSLKPNTKSFDHKAGASNNPDPKKTLRFNMVRFSNNCYNTLNDTTGPLLDDGAPYSGLGEEEFKHLQPIISPDWNGKYDPLPESIADRPYWQYGSGSHASTARRIIGSVVLKAITDNGTPLEIRHLIISGSSQWIIGRNMTRYCDIVHIDGHILKLPKSDLHGNIPLIEGDLHSYIPFEVFFCGNGAINLDDLATLYCATATIDSVTETRPWAQIKKIVDKVHKHVCGHSSYTDIKLLLQRNGLWSVNVQKYLAQTLDTCINCHTTHNPQPPRKVSLSSMSRDFNSVLCIDHFYLEDSCVLHFMDSSTRYSAGDIVTSTDMTSAIDLLETQWFSSFWIPDTTLFDQAFDNDIFKNYMEMYDINCRPIPPRRHNKHALESKHKIIRDIYVRLKANSEDSNSISSISSRSLVQQSLRISNDLYGNDTMSAHELAKGFTSPIRPGIPNLVPDDIKKAHETLLAKRKLTLILRSKATNEFPLKIGDNVHVFVKNQNDKRGRWTDLRPIISYDHASRTVTVPGKPGRKMKAAIEDIRPAISNDNLASLVQEVIDSANRSTDAAIEDILSENEVKFSSEFELSESAANATDTVMPNIGDKIQVFWPLDDQFYKGSVTKHDKETGKFTISYDDGDKEVLQLEDETWKFQAQPVQSNNALLEQKELERSSEEALDLYDKAFGSKEFLLYQAEGLPSFVTHNAYNDEELMFKKTVREVHVSRIPANANVITSHVLYKIKTRDNGFKYCKARIAPHGNKDRDTEGLKSDSATCPPVGIRMLLSIATIKAWPIAKIDFKSAYLQTGVARRDVYVVPPKECANRSHYWLLLTAAYGLVNAGAKWQEVSDNFFHDLGFSQLAIIPQLFCVLTGNELQIAAVKVVDDVLFCGPRSMLQNVIRKIQSRFTLGDIFYAPGTFYYYGLTISQDEEWTISLHADKKLEGLKPYPIDRWRRKQTNDPLNALEISSFRSLNSSIGWLGTAVSPICSFTSSYLQQRRANPTVQELIVQSNSLRYLKKICTRITFKRPNLKECKPKVFIFADASRLVDHGQLAYIGGLLLGELRSGTVTHTISWVSHKSRRLVKFIGSAEVLAAGEAIDEGKVLKRAYSTLLNLDLELVILIDSKDLHSTLTTCRNATDRSIRADVSVIRFEYETKTVNQMIWIPGNTNLADAITKQNSPLVPTLQLMLFDGTMPFDFNRKEVRSSSDFTG